MTTKEMLEKIVQAAIEGGFDPNIFLSERNKRDGYVYYEYFIFTRNIDESGSGYGAVFKYKANKFYHTTVIQYLERLILSRDFMRAVFGDGCSERNNSVRYAGLCDPYDCATHYVNCIHTSYIHHTTQASRIAVTDGIDAAVKYLYDNLPKGVE